MVVPASRPSVFLQSGRKRALEYTPGSRVEATAADSRAMEETRRKRMRTIRNKANKSWFLNLPAETEDRILAILTADRSCHAIMRLSMVNRGWRETIQNNLEVWHSLYRLWRGPIVASDSSSPRTQGVVAMSQRRMVRLNPTTPRTLPNFRHKTPSIS
jgi:hypothetical protein